MWHELKYFATSVGLTLSVAYTVMHTTAYPRHVQGVSMQPVLNPEFSEAELWKERNNWSLFPLKLRRFFRSDIVLVNRWLIRNYDLKRGDIVILISPENPDEVLIKRLIAMEGDTVKPLWPYANLEKTLLIPKGHCWVEGDNHAMSLDSNTFGPVPLGLIIAKATHIIWPVSRFCKLESKYPEERVVGPLVSLFGDS